MPREKPNRREIRWPGSTTVKTWKRERATTVFVSLVPFIEACFVFQRFSNDPAVMWFPQYQGTGDICSLFDEKRIDSGERNIRVLKIHWVTDVKFRNDRAHYSTSFEIVSRSVVFICLYNYPVKSFLSNLVLKLASENLIDR